MNIVRRSNGIEKTRSDGTQIVYHLFDEYEIHYNVLPARITQGWHHHDQIEEVICVTGGEIDLHWLRGGDPAVDRLSPGDIAQVGRTVHTLSNPLETPSTFLVMRVVLAGRNLRELFKTDKVEHEAPTPHDRAE